MKKKVLGFLLSTVLFSNLEINAWPSLPFMSNPPQKITAPLSWDQFVAWTKSRPTTAKLAQKYAAQVPGLMQQCQTLNTMTNGQQVMQAGLTQALEACDPHLAPNMWRLVMDLNKMSGKNDTLQSLTNHLISRYNSRVDSLQQGG